MNATHGVLERLGQQLLGCASASLLDTPLDRLAEEAEDEIVREVLQGIFEAGEADTLRHLCSGDALARWVNEVSTPREEQALRAELRRYLGMGHFGPDDPARLTKVAPIPGDLEALLAWARPYGLLGELSRPASEVLVDVEGLAPDASLVECALGRATLARGAGSLLAGERAREAARSHLLREAAQQGARAARETLFRTSTHEGAPRKLEERLRAVLAGRSLASIDAVRFLPARPVSIDASGTARGHFQPGEGRPPIHTRLFLSGYEQRALEGECDVCVRQPCLHVASLAARVLEALLLEGDRLHPQLVALTREPSWKRFLDALEPESPAEDERGERIGFRLRVEGERAVASAVLEKRRPDGRWTEGASASFAKLLRSPACTERDRAVLEQLVRAGRSPGVSQVPAELAVLRALVDHPHVAIDGVRGSVRLEEQVIEVALEERPEGLLPRVSLGGSELPRGERPAQLGEIVHFDRAHSTLIFAPLGRPIRRMLAALEDFRGLLPKESHPRLAPMLASMSRVARIRAPQSLQGTELPASRTLLMRITPSFDVGVDAAITIRALPMAPPFEPGQGPEIQHGFVDGKPVYARRDHAWERRTAKDVVAALGLDDSMRLGPYTFRIEDEQRTLELLSAAAKLGDALTIEWAEHQARPRILGSASSGSLRVGISTKGRFFALQGGIETPVADVAIGRLLDAARRGDRFVAVRGRDYLEIERELFERLERAQLCVNEPIREASIPKEASAFFVAALGDAAAPEDAPAAAYLERARTLSSAPIDELPLSPELASRLRDYQREGVAFLIERSRWAPGVCLADEMGLGKTVQAIALLEARASLGPQLVVAPTSVVANWVDELARFAPALEVRVHRGESRRERLVGLGPGCVVITSYDLLLRDRADFEGLSFATQIVDEAQMVKNATTGRAKAVAGIDATFRVALSGTPVENRLGDLYSLFHLLAPGLFGSWPRFRARFAVPIERYQKEERAEALRALIAPFVLRRTKELVAPELPARTEVVHHVELSKAEKDLYDAAVRKARRAIGKQRDDEASRTVRILAELTRLRQLACHPRLVIEDSTLESSKLHALLDLLGDLLPRGHRLLVFSQFTRHLALVREALDAAAIAHLDLDGSTPAAERARRVAAFQRGDAPVFLISLKAGGTGLNLTAADYVIHLDPWWNPAAEDQASDRAHRIGQQRPITIVKLVSQGTIEEAVLALHGEKRRLAHAALGSSESALPLDADALEQLLALG